ncbi:hypothetical protein GCM10020254_07800 [Streptomyces goshikiensis]
MALGLTCFETDVAFRFVGGAGGEVAVMALVCPGSVVPTPHRRQRFSAAGTRRFPSGAFRLAL